MEPDILFIDEVLAVGDAAFRTKCIRRMAELGKKCAIIFVSHAMPLIGRMSNKAILMIQGKRINPSYDVPEAINKYLELNKSVTEFVQGDDNIQLIGLKLNSIDVLNKNGFIEVNQYSKIELDITARYINTPEKMLLNIGFFDQEEKLVLETFSSHSEFYVTKGSTAATIKVVFDNLFLNSGVYAGLIGFVEVKEDGGRGDIVFLNRGHLKLLVKGKSIGYSPVQQNCSWKYLNTRDNL